MDGIASALFIIYPWGDQKTWFDWKLNPSLGSDYNDYWNGAIYNDSPHICGDLFCIQFRLLSCLNYVVFLNVHCNSVVSYKINIF